jgi:hypothetical protein
VLGGGPVKRLFSYLRARFREKSTIASLSGALPTAVQVGSPLGWILIALAIGITLYPTSPDPNLTGEPQ